MPKDNWEDIGNPKVRHKLKVEEQQQRAQPQTPEKSTFIWTPQAMQMFAQPPAPVKTRENIYANQQSFDEKFSDWDWQNQDQIGPEGESLPVLAQGWKPDGSADFGEGFSGWLKKAASNVQTSYWKGYEEGLKISGLTEFAVKKVKGEEEGSEILADVAEKRKPESQRGAYFTGAVEATKEIFEQAMWGVLDTLALPAELTEQAIGAAVLTVGDKIEGRDANWQRNWDASRLAYSMVFDSTIRAEMNARLDAGMRPDLAQMEVMQEKPWTIWPELIGQLAADPLWAVTWVSKGGKAIKVSKSYKATFGTVADPGVAKIIDEAAKIGDDVFAARKLDDIIKSQEGLAAVGGHQEKIVNKTKELVELADNYAPNALTSGAKASHVSGQTGEVLLHIANNASADEAPEILRAMYMSASADKFEAAEGVAGMLKFVDPKALFSEAGNATTSMLKMGVDKWGATWFDDIAAILKTKGKPGLVDELFDRMDTLGEHLYPSVSKMVAAQTKAADIIKAGGVVDDVTKRLAAMADDVPASVRRTAVWHDRVQKMPVGPLNRFFVGTYLGWNPGYAARNYANNVLTVLVDQGPMAILGNADRKYDTARALHGAAAYVPGAHAFGVESSFEAARKIIDQPTGLKGLAQSAVEGVKTLRGPSRTVAETMELQASKQIIGHAYRGTFRKGVKAMVKESSPILKEAGYSDDFIRKLPSLIEQHNGEVDDIIGAVREMNATGTIRLFDDVGRVPDTQRSFLEGVNKWDEYVETVMRAETPEAALKGAQKIYDDIAKFGDEVHKQGIPTASEEGRFLQMVAENGDIGQARGQIIEMRIAQNNKALDTVTLIEDELERAVNIFSAKTGQKLDTPAMKAARGIKKGVWSADARTTNQMLRDRMLSALKQSKAKGADQKQLWKEYGEFFADLGDPPIMNGEHFRDALMHQYDVVTKNTYIEARNKAIEATKGYIDDLAETGVPTDPKWKQTIDIALEEASKFDEIQIGRGGRLETAQDVVVSYGTRTSQIAGLAQKYGLDTAVVKGETFIPTDKKTLDVINKYAQTRYTSLEEVPLSIADAAFARRAGQTSTYRLEKLAEQYGVMDEAESVSIVNKYMEKIYGVDAATTPVPQVKKLADVPEDVLRSALRDRLVDAGEGAIPKGMTLDDFMTFADEATESAAEAKKLLPPYIDGEAPTLSRIVYDSMDDLADMKKWTEADIAKNFHKKQVVDPVSEKALQALEKQMGQKIAETRLISSRYAQAARDFALLNYAEKKYYDVALAYLYPFGFWHRGTYANWMKRVATNPAVLGQYSRYKDDMATIHADMPEWWKYNLNTNDLPGIETENPIYLNLEATLWPLNGITGTDFNDPYRKVNWWTYSLDFMNKFGATTWAPINMITGLMLQKNGEEEAGDRWLGRLIPQSAAIKAAASQFGISNFETDPFVTFLMDGIDPYERRRVGRALSAMEQEAADGISQYTREQIYDAATSREGPIWDEAVKRAVYERSMPNLTSFMFGVGLKGRTEEDMQVDKFYQDYQRLWGMEPNLRPEEFREGMDGLREKYPFMETVLISRRSGIDRDRGIAYNALSRIPPGRSSDYAEMVGIDPEMLGRFYDEKGHIENWSKPDQMEFMSGVLRINALLQIPGNFTRQNWSAAKTEYSGMQDLMKKSFGDDIMDRIDVAFGKKKVSSDAFNAYMDSNPDVEAALNFRSQYIISNQSLSTYYGGAGTIEGYLKSQMYDALKEEFGDDIFDIVGELAHLKTWATPEEAKKFERENKKVIDGYYDGKDEWSIKINKALAQVSAHLPDRPVAEIRPDAPNAVKYQEQMSPPPGPTFQEWQSMTSPYLMDLVMEYYESGEDIGYSANQQLARIARDMGYESGEDVLQAIGTSMYQAK